MNREWKWFGNAGHFICGASCRFHLTTQVGKYIVSTVGQYWPERPVREIHATVHDPAWFMAHGHLKGDEFDAEYMNKFGYEQIGCDRTFETMVFKAGKTCKASGCDCGLPKIEPSELDYEPANTAGEATKNHMKLCQKWAKKEVLNGHVNPNERGQHGSGYSE